MTESAPNHPIESPSAASLGEPAPAEVAADVVSTPGELRTAREAQGLSVADVAAKLRMGARQIDAMERGDWASLPGLAFVRGAVRSYGRLLEQDVGPLLASIGGFAEPTAKAPARPRRTGTISGTGPGFSKPSGGARWLWAVLGAIGVVGIAVFFGRPEEVSSLRAWFSTDGQESSAPGPQAPTTARDSIPVAGPGATSSADVAPASPATPNAGGSARGGAPSPAGDRGADVATSGADSRAPTVAMPTVAGASGSAPAAAAPAGASSSGGASAASAAPAAAVPAAKPSAEALATTTPVAAPASTAVAAAAAVNAPSPAARPPALRFGFSRESWIEVRDANGKVLVTGTQQPGTSLDVDGVAPFALIVGNAGGVTLERAGKPIALARGAREGVARLRIE